MIHSRDYKTVVLDSEPTFDIGSPARSVAELCGQSAISHYCAQ